MLDPLEILNLRLALGVIDQAAYDQAVAAVSAGGAKAPSASSTSASAEHRALYGIYRDYIKHEDDLTHQRLGWNLTIQGFLFTAYGFIFQKTAELWNALAAWRNGLSCPAPPCETPIPLPAGPQIILHGLRQLHWALIVLAGASLLVTIIVALGTRAAHLAIMALNDQWLCLHPDYKVSAAKPHTHGPKEIGLPGMIGGGNPGAAVQLGFQAVRFLPWLLIVVWFSLGFNSVRELFVVIQHAASGVLP